ncbi:catalase [Terriglobus sp. ADX1]|uniref:catalase n=1 Tax=Terriglobus sp. ADX1 TaxID=2794063 RepID=UPI002FE56125
MNHGEYVLAEELVDLIHQNFQGFHAGYRDVHAAGRYYAATFTATPAAKALTRAVHMQGQSVPATVRHSKSASGNPLGPSGAPSIAVKFFLPNGTVTDLIGLTVPLFPTRTPEETVGLLQAARPEVPNGEPNLEKLREFASTRPWVAHALQVIQAVPAALSLAQTEFHALHAFRFVSAANEMQYGRYHWEPVAGVASQTSEELLALPQNYLFEELEERLRNAPVGFDLVLELAGEGDPIDDPNAPWAAGRPRVTLGRLELIRPTTVEEIGDPVMLHDPTRLTDGIEVSNDPILAARRGIYEVSVALRTGGWKGRQAAWDLEGACPFSSIKKTSQ